MNNLNNIKTQVYTDVDKSIQFIHSLDINKPLAVDIETPGLDPIIYPRILGISISQDIDSGTYIDVRSWSSDTITELIKGINTFKDVWMWNYGFDRYYTKKVYGEGLKCDKDMVILYHLTHRNKKMLKYDYLSYSLACSSNKKGHYAPYSLKSAAADHLNWMQYDKPLDEFKKKYCKEHDIKSNEFTYDLFPIELLGKYACYDAVATLSLGYIFLAEMEEVE